MKKSWLRDNGLTLALLGLFLGSAVGQALTGWRVEVGQDLVHGEAAPTLVAYLGGGMFLSTLFENWESEFLQMWAFVMLTAYLIQKGSSESRKPDEQNPQDRDPKLDEDDPKAPWPVRAGGAIRVLYAHSLGVAFLLLFIGSFVLHLVNSHRRQVEEAQMHHRALPTLFETFGGPEFWFESFQNWQSEFFATAVLIILGIYLRERHSPESKPVGAPYAKTGAE